MAYVVKDSKECLIGKRDREALGLIMINPNGANPEEDQSESCPAEKEKGSPKEMLVGQVFLVAFPQ